MPSSSANLGPGFDVFSMALNEPSLLVGARCVDGPAGVELVVRGRYAAELSLDLEKNAAGRAASLVLERWGLRRAVRIIIDAGIPVRKGLGASGAEAVGAVVVLSSLFGLNLSPLEVVELASSVEPGGHADNVAASTLGGICIIGRLSGRLDVLRLEPPPNLGLVVIVPSIFKPSTGAAREVIPKSIKMEDHVRGLSDVAMVTAGLLFGDLNRVFRHVSFDHIVEAARANARVYGEAYNWETLLEEKQALLDRYNVALTISGAGPSRLLWYDVEENSRKNSNRPIDEAVRLVTANLERRGYRVEDVIYTRPASRGAALITSLPGP